MSADLNLELSKSGRLVLIDAAGVRHENVKPVRLFPLTDATHWVAICGADGRELACIEDVSTIPEEQRARLSAALATRDFVPIIQSIQKIRRAAHGHEWFVTTDRGPTSFSVENDENIQSLSNGRLVIIDQRNTRYLIPNVSALDTKSRQRLERYS
jgi:hypothetical protein